MIPQMHGGAKYREGTRRVNLFYDNVGTDTEVSDSGVTGDANCIQVIPYESTDSDERGILRLVQGVAEAFLIKLSDPGARDAEAYAVLDPEALLTPLAAITTTAGVKFNYAQVGNTLYLTESRGLFPPIRFYLSGGSYYVDYAFKTGTLANNTFFTYPYGPINALNSNVTMAIPAVAFSVGGTFTLTASAAYFASTDVGRFIRLANSTTSDAMIEITAYTSTTQVTATVRFLLALPAGGFTFGSTTNSASFWQISAWGGAAGWPKVVTSFQGRLIYASSDVQTDTIWGSRISNVRDFVEVPRVDTTGIGGYASGAYTSDNSRPFTLTPNSPQASTIVGMSSAKTLLIHTDRNETVAYGSDGALGPNNVIFESSTSFGAEAVQPVRINNYATFVQRGGFRLRDVVYNFNEDQYKSSDLSFVADHFFLDGGQQIAQLTALQDASSVLFCRSNLGSLYAVTLDRDYQVNGWCSLPLGAEESDEPVVLAMCTHNLLANECVFMVVQRTHNGATFISYEYLINAYTGGDERYLDCRVSCVNPTPGVANTTHYVNVNSARYTSRFSTVEVSVIADGNYIGELTVATGATNTITLPSAYINVYVGFHYSGVLKTNNLMAGGQIGLPLGRIRRADEVAIQLFNTRAAWVGINDGDTEELALRSATALIGVVEDPYTGLQVVPVPGGYERDLQITVEQRRPGPLYVVYLAARGSTNES
jgi:hypothetical protein